MKNRTLHRDLQIPLYIQLRELLMSDIRDGVLKPGEMIPTEFDLMEEFGVSRNVVRQAIGDLVDGGYLIRMRAKGTFVSTPTANVEQLSSQEAFRETVMNKGAIPVTKVLAMEVLDAEADIAALLGVPVDTRIIRIKRLRYSNDVPVSLSTAYLPYAKCSFVLEHRFQTDSLHRVLSQRYDTRVYRSTQRFEARMAHSAEADLLEIPQSSVVQCVTRQGYNRMNAVIEVTIAVYRGDFELSFETVERT